MTPTRDHSGRLRGDLRRLRHGRYKPLRVPTSRAVPSQVAERPEHILVSVDALCLSARNKLGTKPMQLRDAQIPLQCLTGEIALREMAGRALLLERLIELVRNPK